MASRPRTPSRREHGGLLTVLAVVVVVLAGLGFAGYWFLIRSDSAPKPKIERTKLSAGGTLTGNWTLTANDPQGSFVGYRVHEKFAQGLVDNDATGRTNQVTGSMTVAGSSVEDVTVEANLATLKSDKDFRDERLRSQGLETDKFPTAKFVSTAPIELTGEPPKGSTVVLAVKGDLTLHGVTKPVSLTLKGRWDGTTIQVVGEMPVVMSDYGMTPPTSPIIAEVDDHGSLEMQLFFTKSG